MAWLFLFTAAAVIAQVQVGQGQQLLATPEAAYLPPFVSMDHPLGTDQLGRDVFLYLLHGCRTSWLLAIPPLLGATAMGIVAGTGAALLGNTGLRISVTRLLAGGMALTVLVYLLPVIKFWWQDWPTYLQIALSAAGALVLLRLLFSAKGPENKKKRKEIALPVDEALQKLIGVWASFPKLLLLLLLTLFTPFSVVSLMVWIAVTYWILPARVARAMVLQLRQEPYYETAQALGIPFWRTFTHYLWPSLQGTLLTNFCFAASGLLGIGSTLAYLGIGLPADVPSWGKMLATARFSLEAWWLIAFPALFLLTSIFSLQSLGHFFSSTSRSNSVTK